MHFHARPSWYLPESAVTPEAIYLNRKTFLKQLGFGALASGVLLSQWGEPQAAESGLPAPANPKYLVKDREVTSEKDATHFNNFYEFSPDKDNVHERVKNWKLEGWKLEIGGLVNKGGTFDVEELVKKMTLEERVYRFRCVEAWAMVVPWTGFPVSQLLDFVEPKPEAKYIKFTTFMNREVALEQFKPWYPWPYTEGLRLDEARNELALLVTGMYGKPLPKQNGGPIRLVVPWKYGFKSIKSLVKIELTAEEPPTFWAQLAASEYGFYANVNPNVDHPRWSQKSERVLGSFFKRQPTQMFNGYAEQVAELYKGMDLTKFY